MDRGVDCNDIEGEALNFAVNENVVVAVLTQETVAIQLKKNNLVM